MKRFDKKLNAQDIINAIPGGVAIYKVSDIFETVYYSDGVPALSGYSRDEYDLLIKQDAADLIYQEDAAMVIRKIRQVLEAENRQALNSANSIATDTSSGSMFTPGK